MNEFPRLKSEAAAQYPLRRTVEFSIRTLRFLGGAEQRFRLRRAAGRRWVVRLDRLDEWEAARVMEFFRAQLGRGGEFAFTDPIDGRRYESCSFEHDELRVTLDGEGREALTLVIKENLD
jgi:hypothetical protein